MFVKKWFIEEDKQLLLKVNKTKNYDEIALNHKINNSYYLS